MPIESALDAVKEWAAGSEDIEETEFVREYRARKSEEDRLIEQNNQALAQLRQMMPGLGV